MNESFNQASQLVQIVRNIIKQELSSLNQTYVAIVDQVNSDGSVTVHLPGDDNNQLRNIQNASKYTLKSGDTILLFAVNGRLSNCFVLTKYNA